MLSELDHQILGLFARRVRERYPDARIWAFGSRARGDAREDSDLDVCVVLERMDRAARDFLSRTAWEVGFEHERLIATVKYDRRQFETAPFSSSPLVQVIMAEGIAA